MSEKRRVAEKNVGAFLGDGGVGLVPTATSTLSVGPGEPGPGDEWKMPLGPIDEIVAQDEAVPEPPAHESLLHHLTHKG